MGAVLSPPELRALVVDDYVDTAESLAMILRAWGYQAWAATCGEEALSLARSHRPDVVFLDLLMPAMTGWELAARLRQLAGPEEMCLIAVSGCTRKEDAARSRAAGCDLHLLKPVNVELLHNLLRGLERRRVMTPEQLTRVLSGMEAAAQVVELIEDRDLQRQQGWDLSSWRYHLVPWGVRFSYSGPHAGGKTEVVALTGPEGVRVFIETQPAGAEAPAAELHCEVKG